MQKTFGDEQLLDAGSQLFFGFRKHPGRNLFTADFEEELDAFLCWGYLHVRTSRGGASPPICKRYDAAVRHARVRTRAMSAARSVVEITPRASSRLKRCEHLRQ